jgi:hypothetical protein
MVFRKHIGVLLAILILVSNVGLAFNVHYCGGKLASISLNADIPELQKEGDCCLKKAIKKESCCKDKKIVFQKKAIDKVFKSFSFQLDATFIVPEYQSTFFKAVPSFKKNTLLSYYCDANAPPLYKLYSQYLLYDTL